ncbi:DNA double-strand break repair nuclease NurA, partial [Candidatus Woesearchaeota archaeon]|nr:DNA double-strand break repair nuclease NurA [Candidatus Woesearchaeota archaeon]
NGNVIVMDGALQAGFTNEEKYLDKLYQEALKKNIIISALSKTNNLYANDGNSVNGLLNSLAEHKTWYYYPIAEINDAEHKAKMFFVKLNPASRHIFRFEVFKDNIVNPKTIFNELMFNSSDPIFPGYPYGLVEADSAARVSNKEKDYLRTIFATKAGKEWEKLQNFLSSANAHDILDNIR